MTVEAAGIPFSALAWGDAGDRPLILIHGVTASAAIWWRVGPRLAAAGRRVVAVDLPGHGLTGHWTGRHRFRETADDLAAFARAAGLARPDLQVDRSQLGRDGHGAPAARRVPPGDDRPARSAGDPAAVVIARWRRTPTWRRYDDLAEARRRSRAAEPDVDRRATSRRGGGDAELEVAAARSVVARQRRLGLRASPRSPDPAAAGIPVWLVRGEPASGGLTPDAAAAEFARRYGDDHVITIAGAPHSPQRTHLDATIAAFERALAS